MSNESSEISSNLAYYIKQYPELKVRVDSLPDDVDKHQLLINLISDVVTAEQVKEFAECEAYHTMKISHRDLTPQMKVQTHLIASEIYPLTNGIEHKLKLAILDKLTLVASRDVLLKNKMYLHNELFEACREVIDNMLDDVDLYNVSERMSNISSM